MAQAGLADTSTSREITLASKSETRRKLLENAGLRVSLAPSGVDETTLKAEGQAQHKPIKTIALELATAKAAAIAGTREGYVIGADQILGCEGLAFDKPETIDQARERLWLLQGRTHYLYTALCVFKDGECDFTDIATPALTMRSLCETEIDAYLAMSGPAILTSVGAYQLEGVGARLFSHIEGQYFDILGLQLLPLLAYFRAEEVIGF